MNKKGMGFGALIQGKREKSIGHVLSEIQPDDLIRYGLIPELVGRLPVVAPLHELDEKALMRILVEPKNSLIKQYQKYFELEKVKLTLTEDAVMAIARLAVTRETGARGLRSILEDLMLDLMYEIPSQSNISEVIINREAVMDRKSPILLYRSKAESA
jgi:ATP-dependent Clp protease ATP-binding subunit ClpX